MFYRLKNENELLDWADYKYNDNCLETNLITQAEYNEHPNKIIIVDGGVALNPDYDQEEAEKERVRIANLHMTRGDVFRGLLLAKGVTRADMRGLIEALPDETPEQKITKEYALIDFDEALEFYRGVALIDTIGEQLGITPEQMNKFFDTKDWHELITEEENA